MVLYPLPASESPKASSAARPRTTTPVPGPPAFFGAGAGAAGGGIGAQFPEDSSQVVPDPHMLAFLRQSSKHSPVVASQLCVALQSAGVRRQSGGGGWPIGTGLIHSPWCSKHVSGIPTDV